MCLYNYIYQFWLDLSIYYFLENLDRSLDRQVVDPIMSDEAQAIRPGYPNPHALLVKRLDRLGCVALIEAEVNHVCVGRSWLQGDTRDGA